MRMDEARLSTRARVTLPTALLAAGALRVPSVRVEAAGTPAPGSSANAPFRSLLGLVPAGVASGGDLPLIAAFADLAAQTSAFGVARPDGIDGDQETVRAWLRTLDHLYIADPFLEMSLKLTRELIGFDLTDVDQTLSAGEPPAILTYLRGRMDPAALRAAWMLQGYELLEFNGVQVASLAPTGELDLTNEIQRLTLGKLNNAALLPDGTLVYADTLDLLTQAIAAASGTVATLAERVDIAAVLDAEPEELATAAIVSGASLMGQVIFGPLGEDVAATIGAQAASFAEMPALALALFGITPGGPLARPLEEAATPSPDPSEPRATIVIDALMMLPGTAETAAEVATKRLETLSSLRTKQPYTEFFSSWDATAIDGQIMRLTLEPSGPPRMLWQMLFARDLLFLAW